MAPPIIAGLFLAHTPEAFPKNEVHKLIIHYSRARNNSRSSPWRRDFSEYFQPIRLKILEKSLIHSDDRQLF